MVRVGLIWLRIGSSGGSCEHGNEPSGSINCWEVLDWLHNWRLLKEGSAPRVSDIMESKLGFRRFIQWPACSYVTQFLRTEKPCSLMVQNAIFLSALCCCHFIIGTIFVIIIPSYFFPSATRIISFLAMVV
jgi:hypothetical protein